MKVRLLGILSAALLLPLLIASCKKEEETKEYMTGTLYMDCEMPSYVKPGDVFTLKPHGVTAPDGTAVGYYVTSPITGKKDTLKYEGAAYEYVIPASLGTYSISCVAYPRESSDKYYVTSASITFTVVSDDPDDGSITDVNRHPGDTQVSFDDRTYYAENIGGRSWVRSNLSHVERDGNDKEVFGRSFMNCPAMQNIFGAYYTWEEAQTVCPSGWHLPSEAEWVAMLKEVGAPADLAPLQDSPCGAGKLMVKARFNGTLMWDYYRNVNIEDKALSAIPVGYATVSGDTYKFSGYNQYAVFWTSDEYMGSGVYRYIFQEYDNVFVGTADKKSFAASVRCVR